MQLVITIITIVQMRTNRAEEVTSAMTNQYVAEVEYSPCGLTSEPSLNQDLLPLPETDSQELVKVITKHSSWPQSIYSLRREMDKWIQCTGKFT